MEPTLPTPHGLAEGGPSFPRGPEVAAPQGPERQRAPEVPALEEQRSGHGAGDGDRAIQAVPVVVPAPPISTQPSAPASPMHDDNPQIAADEDLIEKEWVDKAKEIIEQTRDDPYVRTQRVNELQRDYLQKRYGKVVGAQE